MREFTEAGYAEFEAAKRLAHRSENLSKLSLDAFGDGRAYLSFDGRTGFFIAEDGTLMNVFNYGAPGRGADAVYKAIQYGANKLDCFDGFLKSYYEQFGFREADRIPFDDKYAPAGWDYARLGRPDVVYMERRLTWLDRSS